MGHPHWPQEVGPVSSRGRKERPPIGGRHARRGGRLIKAIGSPPGLHRAFVAGLAKFAKRRLDVETRRPVA
jgi:hypothetical protein